MVRRLAMPAASAAAVVATARVLAWGTGAPLDAVRDGTAGLNEQVGLAAALAAWVVLGWVVAVLLSTLLAAAPGAVGRSASRVGRRLAPAAARNVARLAVGLAVTAGPLTAWPAAAGPVTSGPVASGPVVASGPATAGPVAPGPGTTGAVTTGAAAEVLSPSSDGGEPTRDIDVSELPGVGRPGQPLPPGSAREPGSPAPSPSASDPAPRSGSSEDDPVLTPTAAPGTGAGTPTTDTADADRPSPGAAASGRPPDAGLTPEPVREPDPTDEVVVRRGDTLWAIAARHLGADATAAEVAAEWPRWYAANRSVIGDDPDLILPGTILRPPHDR